MTDLIVSEEGEELENVELSDTAGDDSEDIPNPYRIECRFDHFEATSDPQENEKLKQVELWDFPDSYRTYAPDEKNILSFIENFNVQFVNLYPKAQQLFLTPYNECNIKKFVCLTVVPTLLKYSELFTWENCSSFVSDYLSFELLPCACKLPRTLFSPNTVLARQCGNSFEYSTVLCSLLLGAGYDAYVVSGRATREICQMVETHEEVEAREAPKMGQALVDVPSQAKYTAKPPRSLSSRYLKAQTEKAIVKKKQEEQNLRVTAKRLQQEREMPDSDPLFGHRVHSWVLICSGKREIAEPFFIEPLTGNGKSVQDPTFLGIDSIWNGRNYWLCLRKDQDALLKFDLDDSAVWEQIFPTEEGVSTSHINDYTEEDVEDIIQEEKPHARRVHLPKPWCSPVQVDLKDFKTHNKNSKRICYYNRQRVETFTPYSTQDGLVKRITNFSDYEQNRPTCVEEYYGNRTDRLSQRTRNLEDNTVWELFKSGRQGYLKEHEYSSVGGEAKRTMRFYHSGRLDCLTMSEIGPFTVVESYEGRDDSLFYRKVEFARKTIKFQTPDNEENPPRTILKISERFSRNREVRADRDIAELVFDSKASKIYVKYHVDDNNIFAATHIFVKSPSSNEKMSELYFDDDMHISFNPKTSSGDQRTSTMYELLLSLVQHEGRSKAEIYESEREVKSILATREREEADPKFTTCHFDLLRSKDIKKIRMDLEETAMREMIRKKEMQLDYLGPYLALFNDPTVLSPEQAIRVREMCLMDLKVTLVKRANYIQNRFEQQTEELKKKQKWYQNNQITLSKEEEVDYIKYCSEAMFRINILEQRLQRHKRRALTKYKELVNRLDGDIRLDV